MDKREGGMKTTIITMIWGCFLLSVSPYLYWFSPGILAFSYSPKTDIGG